MNMTEILIYNKDWTGFCVLDKKYTIYRKDYKDEKGTFEMNGIQLKIYWEKWDPEILICIDKKVYIYEEKFRKEYDLITIYENRMQEFFCILSKMDRTCRWIDEKILSFSKGVYEKNGKNLMILIPRFGMKIYHQISDSIYFLKKEYDEYYFVLEIKKEIYHFHRKSMEFYHEINMKKMGNYEISMEKIKLFYSSGIMEEHFFFQTIPKKENIHIVYPKKVIIDDRILISNLTLCKNKIILTSCYYQQYPWDITSLHISLQKTKIINQTIHQNNHFEASLCIVYDLDQFVNEEEVRIFYQNREYIFWLHNSFQELENISLCAMTLFYDDYPLLKKYIEYYHSLGINHYFFYYNDQIQEKWIQEIYDWIPSNVHLYITEWSYQYWWNYYDGTKQHHAQMMAITDSLHILKNYVSHILYNDLDEYFVMKCGMNELIQENPEVDLFVFKNQFCKMGNEKISYIHFYDQFDMKKIHCGNLWNHGREKNIIRTKKIDKMGVHDSHDEGQIERKEISIFYHIVNFQEKYRENLMVEY